MSGALFDLDAPEPERLQPVAQPRTAADVKEMLRARYSAVSPGNGPRFVLGFEVRNAEGFHANRSCDLLVMDTWTSGPVRLIGHEIKVTRRDWLRELRDPEKSAAFIAHVAEWWLVAAGRGIVKPGELPEGWGLMLPAGDSLRAVTNPARRAQGQLPLGLTAALLRSVQGKPAARPRPHTVETMPMLGGYEDIPRAENGWDPARPAEIQEPNYELRRRR